MPTHLIPVSPVSVSGVLYLVRRRMKVVELLPAVERLLRAVRCAQIHFGTISRAARGGAESEVQARLCRTQEGPDLCAFGL